MKSRLVSMLNILHEDLETSTPEEIFGLPIIGFWQAWGLFFLTGLLVKGGGSSK